MKKEKENCGIEGFGLDVYQKTSISSITLCIIAANGKLKRKRHSIYANSRLLSINYNKKMKNEK